MLDLSASMRFGGASQEGRGKDGLLTELAVCLARLFTQGGNRIGAVLYDNGLQRVVPARTGRTHVLRLAHEIGKATEALASRKGTPGTATDVDAMLRLAASQALPAQPGVRDLRLPERRRW